MFISNIYVCYCMLSFFFFNIYFFNFIENKFNPLEVLFVFLFRVALLVCTFNHALTHCFIVLCLCYVPAVPTLNLLAIWKMVHKEDMVFPVIDIPTATSASMTSLGTLFRLEMILPSHQREYIFKILCNRLFFFNSSFILIQMVMVLVLLKGQILG